MNALTSVGSLRKLSTVKVLSVGVAARNVSHGMAQRHRIMMMSLCRAVVGRSVLFCPQFVFISFIQD